MRYFGTLAVGAALLLTWQAALGAEGDAITVELQSFKFKAREDGMVLHGYDEGQSRLFYYTGGPGEATVKIPADGEFELVIKASGDPALNERAKFKVSLGGEAVGKETLLTSDLEKEYKFVAKAKAGEQKLVIEYTNDVYKENEYDRNFYVHAVKLTRAK